MPTALPRIYPDKPLRESRPYHIWNGMIQRCYRKKAVNYRYYGNKGITICEEWKDFYKFWEDMKDTYSDNLSLDRIDNSKGYSKENCRWSTTIAQCNNKTDNKILEFNGESHTIADWGRVLKVDPNRIHLRLCRGWSIERALSTPFIPCPQRRHH